MRYVVALVTAIAVSALATLELLIFIALALLLFSAL